MSDVFLVMKTSPPEIRKAAAEKLLHDQYGIDGILDSLASEHDQNFRVRSASGESFVLKIVNSAEAAVLTNFRIAVISHIAEVDPSFPVPRIVQTRDGAKTTTISDNEGRRHVVLVLTWLEGLVLRYADPAADNAEALGSCLARLDVALRDFPDPAIDLASLWDLKRAANLLEFVDRLKDPALRRICRSRLVKFTERATPVLNGLDYQVIHSDLNSGNVIVDASGTGRIAGIIDFGDTIYSPVIVDVAIAAAYLIDDTNAPLTRILTFLRGYAKLSRLTETETDLLYDLMLARNVTTIVIGHWLAEHYPENKDYILLDDVRARKSIGRLMSMGRAEVSHSFRVACAQ